MRLLGLTNFTAPLGYGYGAICGDVMGELSARGHAVTLLCADGGEDRRFEVRRELEHLPGAWRRPVGGLRAERTTQRAVRRAVDAGVDVALAWHMRGIGKGALTLLHDAGVPVIYMLGDLWAVYERPGPPSWWARWSALDRRPGYVNLRSAAGRLGALAGVDLRPPPIAEHGTCVFASHWLQARYAAAGFSPRSAHVVPNALPPAGEPAPAPRPPGPGAHLVFAGRLDQSKGADLAVRALAAIPEATLSLAGGSEPSVVDGLRRLAADCGVADRVRLLGPLLRADTLGLIAGGDVLLMPGRIEEAFGLVYLEAMSVGTPAVGTARGGAAEFCSDGKNMLAVPPDPEAVAGATRRLLEDAALRERLVVAGRETAAQHELGPMVDRIGELLAMVAPT